jgi:hypothetical protein
VRYFCRVDEATGMPLVDLEPKLRALTLGVAKPQRCGEPRSEAIEGNFGDDPLDTERIPQKGLS